MPEVVSTLKGKKLHVQTKEAVYKRRNVYDKRSHRGSLDLLAKAVEKLKPQAV
jgi:hypothetical protein